MLLLVIVIVALHLSRLDGGATPAVTPGWSRPKGCSTRRDCSHNGECVGGQCQCSSGWASTDCSQLRFGAASPILGLGSLLAENSTSSWGGAVVRGDDGIYHMFAAVMAEHCGLGTYKSNSYVGHATSPEPLTTPFVLRDTSINSYAHEPNAIRAPSGEYVLFFTAAYRRNGSNWSIPVWGDEAAANPGPVDCSVPASEQRGFTCSHSTKQCVNVTGNPEWPSFGQCMQMGCAHFEFPGRYQPACLSWGCWDDPTYMSWSMNPDGPWSDPVIVLDPLPSGDTNLAGVINEDGSFVGIWREPAPAFDPVTGQLQNNKWVSAMRPVRASNWKDPSSYWVQPSASIIPEGPSTDPPYSQIGLEDPMLWKDAKGVYHTVLSNGQYHAWSEDGVAWTLTSLMDYTASFKALPCEGFGGRPHLVFSDDGFTPIAMTGSCFNKSKPVPFGGSTFTALVPINAASS